MSNSFIKVAFYLNNSRIPNLDYSHLEKGNPGIGGTPYLIILVATELAKRNNGIDVTLFVDKTGSFSSQLNVVEVADCMSAICEADNGCYDYIVVNSMYVDWDHFDFNSFKNNTRIIPWCHNFNKYSWNRIFLKEERIARFITVSREQLDLLRDHQVFEKGDYIFNSVPFDKELLRLDSLTPNNKREHSVVFLGSLLWGKSFHVLASIWPDIIRQVPDAQLYVIGSGSLYNKTSKMGRYGIAAEPYESAFMKYLSSKTGEIISSVHFIGNLGMEKFDVLRNAKVAVPNPRGTGETFCISAVEMQIMGCNVASMEAPGYFDTIHCGVLVKNKSDLKRTIVQLLNTSNLVKDYNETLNYIENNFSINAVIGDWEKLLLGDMKHHIHPIEPISNPSYRLKAVKEYLRKNKCNESLLRFLPSIDFYYDFFDRLRDKIEKMVRL